MPKVWYVAIVGRPNAWKSTLLNALIWEKVSAISPRPQTTIRSIPWIFTDETKELQIIFLDTPGIHETEREQFGSQKNEDIHTRINSEAFASLRQADVIVRLLDPTRPAGREDERIDEVLSFSKKPVLRVETKQDLTQYAKTVGEDIVRVNSLTKEGFDILVEKLSALLPEGPYLYDADQYTVQTIEFRVQEIIREQLFQELTEEIPYACFVEVGSVENHETMLSVQAYINTETDSQKTIVIGKKGQKIQEIGTKSRLVLENIFGKKVFLGLRVKVMKNWRKDEKVIARLFPKK
jgi:GTP-binding protein Era